MLNRVYIYIYIYIYIQKTTLESILDRQPINDRGLWALLMVGVLNRAIYKTNVEIKLYECGMTRDLSGTYTPAEVHDFVCIL